MKHRVLGCGLIALAAALAAELALFVPDASACPPGFKPKPGVTSPTVVERDCEPVEGSSSTPSPSTSSPPPSDPSESRRRKTRPVVPPSVGREKAEKLLRERMRGGESLEPPRAPRPQGATQPPAGETDDAIRRLGKKLREEPCQRLTRAKEQASEKKDECDSLRRRLRQAEVELENYQHEYERREAIYRSGGNEFSLEDLEKFRVEKVERAEEEVEELKRKLRACEEARERIEGEIAKLPGCGGEKAEPEAGLVEERGETVTRAPEPRPECKEGARKLSESEVPFACKVFDRTRQVGLKLVPGGYAVRGSEEGLEAVVVWIDLMKCLGEASEWIPDVGEGGVDPGLLSYCFKASEILGEAILELGKKGRFLDAETLTGVFTIPIIEKECGCRYWEVCSGGKWQPVMDTPAQLTVHDEKKQTENHEYTVDVQPRDRESHDRAVEEIRRVLEGYLRDISKECTCPARASVSAPR